MTYHYCAIYNEKNGDLGVTHGILSRDEVIKTKEDYDEVVDRLNKQGYNNFCLISLTPLGE